MIGIIVFVIALFAMFAWFLYLVVKDPANVFKRRPRDGAGPTDTDDGPP